MITDLDAERLLTGDAPLGGDLQELADLLASAREAARTPAVQPGAEVLALLAGASVLPPAPPPRDLRPLRSVPGLVAGPGARAALAAAAAVAVVVLAHQVAVGDERSGELPGPAGSNATDTTTQDPSRPLERPTDGGRGTDDPRDDDAPTSPLPPRGAASPGSTPPAPPSGAGTATAPSLTPAEDGEDEGDEDDGDDGAATAPGGPAGPTPVTEDPVAPSSDTPEPPDDDTDETDGTDGSDEADEADEPEDGPGHGSGDEAGDDPSSGSSGDGREDGSPGPGGQRS